MMIPRSVWIRPDFDLEYVVKKAKEELREIWLWRQRSC
jgi:hypothetical protein